MGIVSGSFDGRWNNMEFKSMERYRVLCSFGFEYIGIYCTNLDIYDMEEQKNLA